MTRLEIAVLGSFQVSRDGAPVTGFESNKARGLLAYLAVESNQPHERETLAGLLWPEQPDRAARQNLSQALYSLRRSLGGRAVAEDLLTADARTVQLKPGGPWALDVATFRELIVTSESHAHRNWRTCTPCARRLRQAATLYRGDFLEQFFLDDSVPFEEWALFKREVMRQAALSALDRLVQYCEWRGFLAEAIGHARRQLELDPLREEFHRQVMRLLAASGQRAAALAQFDHGRRLLAADLGVEPEGATRHLVEQIRASTEPALLTTFRAPLTNLPAAPTSLIGRAKNVEDIKELLLRDDVRLLTLTGSPGIGKTRLALQAASELRFDFDDGVYFVALAPMENPDLVIPAIAQILTVRETGAASISAALAAHLRDKHLLLVLDNFEQVLEAAPLVADLLASCPNVKILVTSRAGLRVRAERQVRASPLALPGPEMAPDPVALSQVASIALFVERAQAVAPEFALNDDNAEGVASICTRLDGLPLAIELVAARLDTLPVKELAARLDHRLALLTDGPRDLPARQQTLRAAIEWSEALLSVDEQALFARLGVFGGGATLQAIETVCEPTAPDPLDRILAGLVHKNLVQPPTAGDSGRYTLLETLREYALERLTARGEIDGCQRRHAQHFLSLAEIDDDEWASPRQPALIHSIEQEHDNLRAALGWAHSNGEVELELRLAGALWKFWDLRGYLSEGRRWLETALAQSNAAGDQWRMARAVAAEGAATLAAHQDDYEAAARFYAEALELYRKLRRAEDVAAVVNHLGVMAQRRGDRSAAIEHFTEAHRLNEDLGDELRAAWALGNLGGIAFDAGNLAQARTLFEKVKETFVRLANDTSVLIALVQLAEVDLHEGNYAEAQAGAEQAIRLSRQIGARLYEPAALIVLGSVFFERGQYSDAQLRLEEARAQAQEMGDQHGTVEALNGLGDVAAARGDSTTARTSFIDSLAILRDLKDQHRTVHALGSIADLCAQDGQWARAARLLAAADTWRGTAPLPPNTRARYERVRGVVHEKLGDEALAALWAEGRALTLDQGVSEADSFLAHYRIGPAGQKDDQ